MKKTAEIRSCVTLNSNGLKLFGVLHMPEKPLKARVPAVLFCHGFGGNKIGKFRLAVRQAEMLALAGVATLRIDFRGSGDSEGDFADTTIQTQLEDARAGLEFLLTHSQIDPNQIAILARSLGGAIATQLASEYPTIKALALWCPLFDAKPWFIKHKGNTSEFLFMGQPLSHECIRQFAMLDTAKPLVRLESMPMLIVRACKDEILDSYHDEQYLASRKNAGLTTHLELANSTHDFGNIPEQQILLEATTSFFKDAYEL